jgi:hypothetical protein
MMTSWTQDVIADIVAALGSTDETAGGVQLLATLDAPRRIGVALDDDDFSHVPTFCPARPS